MRQGRGRPEKHETRNRSKRSVTTLHCLSSLPCRTCREGTHGAAQHELVVKHREGQDHIASDSRTQKGYGYFSGRAHEQEGFLQRPAFSGTRAAPSTGPHGHRAKKAHPDPQGQSTCRAMRRFLEAGHVQSTKKACARGQ